MEQPRIEKEMMMILLLSGQDMPSVGEVSRKVHTSTSTVYRHIRSWREQGFDIRKKGRGIYHIESMPQELSDFRNMVYFTEEEAYVVNSMIAALDDTNALKRNIMRKLASIYACSNLAFYAYRKEITASIRSLTSAIGRKRQAVLHGYSSGHSHTVRDRLVEPYGFTANYSEVWCYDLEEDTCKTFKVSRIGKVEVLDGRWTHEGGHRSVCCDVFGIHGGGREHVVLEMGVLAKNLLLEEFPAAREHLRKRGDRWILDTHVCGMEGVGRFVMGTASDIRIVKGRRLREYIGDYVRSNLNETSGR